MQALRDDMQRGAAIGQVPEQNSVERFGVFTSD
jgi:hypothetical protein